MPIRGNVLVYGNFAERIGLILKELKTRSIPVKVTSFFNELPVKVKMRIVDVDSKRRTVGWEGGRKLTCAIDETKRIYFQILDPKYDEVRVLSADVIFYAGDYVETTFPRFAIEPKLNRRFLRVTTSEKLPVSVSFELGGFLKSFKVIDISEGGIAFVSDQEVLKLGDIVDMKLSFLDLELNVSGLVVNRSVYGRDLERIGIKFLKLKEKDRRSINRYILQRQKEIISKIKLLNDENI